MIQDWILTHHQALNLEIEVFRWPKELNTPLYDIQVNIEFEGIKANGRSVDNLENSALLKAVAEAIERWAVQKFKISSSNGVATHIDIVQAQINAHNELLERDAFLCHYLTKTPWYKSEATLIKDNDVYLKSQAQGFQIEIGWKKTFLDQYVAIAIAKNITQKNNPLVKGIYLGLACSEDLNSSIKKAFNELTMTLGHALSNGKSHPLSLDQFNSLNNWGPQEHGRLALHRSNQIHYVSLFNFEEIPSVKFSNLSESYQKIDFEYKNFDLPKIFDPFKVVQASSNQLQNLYFGPTEFHKLNLNRLCEFKKLEPSELNLFPHPLA